MSTSSNSTSQLIQPSTPAPPQPGLVYSTGTFALSTPLSFTTQSKSVASQSCLVTSDIEQLSSHSDVDLLSPGSILSVPSCPNDGSISYVTQSALSDISSLSNSPSLCMHSRCSGTRVTDVHISGKRFSFPCVINANLRGAFCRKLDKIEETLNQFKVDVAFFHRNVVKPHNNN